MSQWSSAKDKRVLASLLRIGWNVKRETSSHKILTRSGWSDVVFAFHDKEEIGPKMLARIAKNTGLRPEDL
jgi:predicted RNA binding protein YcfA (HicA-like mRNA interferase family)